MDIDKLITFYHVAKAENISRSGVDLSPSTISRQIKNLETELNVDLFYRYPNRLLLTEEGHILFDVVGEIISKLEYVKESLFEAKREPQGVLRIVVPKGWPSHMLMRRIPEFLELYPLMRIEMAESDKAPDFTAGEADVALFPHITNQLNLNQKFVARFHYGLFASKGYLAKYGMPKTIADLDDHRLIIYGDKPGPFQISNWHLMVGREAGVMREPYMIVDHLLEAAVQDLGIITLVKENKLLYENDLVPVMPELEGPKIELFYIVPEHLKNTKKVKAFSEFLKEIIDTGL